MRSIRERILKATPRLGICTGRGVAVRSIRERILKEPYGLKLALFSLSCSEVDPGEDTESDIYAPDADYIGVVAVRSIRERILKVYRRHLNSRPPAVAVRSIRERILKA